MSKKGIAMVEARMPRASRLTPHASQPANYNANWCRPDPIELVIPTGCAGLRLDQALARLLPDFSRSRLQTWIRDQRVRLNDGPADPKRKVWGGESVQIEPMPNPAETSHAPEAIPLAIVYQDHALIVVDKPAGLVVHPGSGNWQGTLLNALLNHCPDLGAIPRAGIVHRLDKETSGLLVIAKTLTAQTSLVRQLQKRTVKRDYFALVRGAVRRDGMVEAPIGRHPTHRTKMAVVGSGKPALTHYKVIEHLPGCTLVQCSLETGRTHQIRVHMHSIGHPLVGDPVYGATLKSGPAEVRNILNEFPRQALHAARLELCHPESGNIIVWESELPDDMQALLAALRSVKHGT